VATTELPEDKIARLLKERLADIDQLRTLPDDLHPTLRRWRERLVTLLKEGGRQGVVREDLAKEIEYQQFTEPRVKMFDEPERSEEDREYYLRGLAELGNKLEAELERIAEFGPCSAQPAGAGRGTFRRQPQSGSVTHVHVGGDNRGVINTGTARDIRVRWYSPEAAAALDELITRVQKMEHDFDERNEVLQLLAAMKAAKHHDERLKIADQLEKFVKIAPAFRWVWEAAKPHLGL